MSSCKTTWSLIVLDSSSLTVVELSLVLAGNSSTTFDTALTTAEASLAVIGEFLIVVDFFAVVAVGASTVSADTLGTLGVSPSTTFDVAGGPLFSIADEAPEPISSINMVFNGFYVPQVTMDGKSDR